MLIGVFWGVVESAFMEPLNPLFTECHDRLLFSYCLGKPLWHIDVFWVAVESDLYRISRSAGVIVLPWRETHAHAGTTLLLKIWYVPVNNSDRSTSSQNQYAGEEHANTVSWRCITATVGTARVQAQIKRSTGPVVMVTTVLARAVCTGFRFSSRTCIAALHLNVPSCHVTPFHGA